jgi:hypothetical protein
MPKITLKGMAKRILEEFSAGKVQAYIKLRDEFFEVKRQLDGIASTRLKSVKDPNFSMENADELENALYKTVMKLNTAKSRVLKYKRSIPSIKVQPLKEVTAELVQVQQEMKELRWSTKQKWVSAVTDRVVLPILDDNRKETGETLDLGLFEIRLSYTPSPWQSRMYKYKIYALKPNWPANEQGAGHHHPHPHVQDHSLCEGEATTAITQALKDFRLCDFFLMINAILNNYNPGSPYVKTGDWHKINCRICGNRSKIEDAVKCDKCGMYICTRCAISRTCVACDKTLCTRCLHPAPIKCKRCNRYFCIKHYKGVRKHPCYKEIKKERAENAKKRELLLGEIDKYRAKIAEKVAKKAEKAAKKLAEAQQQQNVAGEVAIQTLESSGPGIVSVRRNTTRPDNRTPADIARDLQLSEEEVSGPAGWV